MTHIDRTSSLTFDFEHWSATAASSETGTSPPETLRITEVTVSPDNRYVFCVTEGIRNVVCFHFTDLPHALEAARDMESLLPKVEAARWMLSKSP